MNKLGCVGLSDTGGIDHVAYGSNSIKEAGNKLQGELQQLQYIYKRKTGRALLHTFLKSEEISCIWEDAGQSNELRVCRLRPSTTAEVMSFLSLPCQL